MVKDAMESIYRRLHVLLSDDMQPSHVRGKKIQLEVIPLAHLLL